MTTIEAVYLLAIAAEPELVCCGACYDQHRHFKW